MARLKIRRHQEDFKEIMLEADRAYTLGRRDDCDVVLQPDPGISRHHLTISFTDGVWNVQSHSQHILIFNEGKNVAALNCTAATTHFSVSPYHFELLLDAAESAQSVVDMEFPPIAPGSESEFISERIKEPLQIDRSEPIDPEVSFHGNEEKTNDVYVSGDPYLKFMYSSHSESIRLKGNKWIAGRDTIVQIQLDDKKASRQHFTIEKVGEQFFIKDLKSANGTLLNGQELKAQEARELKSGDIITVNALTMIFEVRDLSFSEKLKDLPLQAYSGPMILTSQDWDIAPDPGAGPAGAMPPKMPVQQLARLPGTVQKVVPPKNPMRTILMAIAAAVVVLAALFYEEEKPKPVAVDPALKTFESLSPEEKKFVVDSYNSAQNYYQEGRIQNALTQLGYVHKTLPFYKDSKELESRLHEAQETLRHKEYIAQQMREQEESRLRVQNIIADCRDRFKDSVDVVAVKGCLNEALQLDPENSDAQSIVSEIEMRLQQAQEAEQRLKEFNSSVEKGRDLYVKAKNLLMNKEYHEAISAFSAHMNSNLPDPDHLKKTSQRAIATIEKHISTQRNSYMGQAQTQSTSGNLRDAILLAEQAKQVDPFDYTINDFIEKTKHDLSAKMRNLYTDSVIEERIGNVELSKARWKEIVDKDIPTGEYYLKAKRKLQQYGL